MAQLDSSMPDYTAQKTADGILFSDRSGRKVALARGNGRSATGYTILNSENKEAGFMTSWSKPSLKISGVPQYASSSNVKLYESENGKQSGTMTITAQSISSTWLTIILLDMRDRITAIIAETAPTEEGKYAIKDSAGQKFADVSRLTTENPGKMPEEMPDISNDYAISVTSPDLITEIMMVKLVVAMMALPKA